MSAAFEDQNLVETSPEALRTYIEADQREILDQIARHYEEIDRLRAKLVEAPAKKLAEWGVA
jgi:hypothetical protein